MQLARNPKWKMFKTTLSGYDASKGTYSTGGVKCYVMEQDPTSVSNAQYLIKAVQEGKQREKLGGGTVWVKGEEKRTADSYIPEDDTATEDDAA